MAQRVASGGPCGFGCICEAYRRSHHTLCLPGIDSLSAGSWTTQRHGLHDLGPAQISRGLSKTSQSTDTPIRRARSSTASAKRCQSSSISSLSCNLLIARRIWTVTSAGNTSHMYTTYMSDNYTIVAADSAAASSKAPGLATL